MIIPLKEYFKRAEQLYGKDRRKWKFKCTGCKRVQSAEDIKAQMDRNEASRRHGVVDVFKTQISPESECYSQTCNWVAYGLFSSAILVVIDGDKPYNENTKENCAYVFPLADDEEMLKAAGVA
jgi:hypothetical protein